MPINSSVLFTGYPLGYQGPEPLMITGSISHIYSLDDIDYLVINAALNKGNSGGPLIDLISNKVVGIVISKGVTVLGKPLKDLEKYLYALNLIKGIIVHEFTTPSRKIHISTEEVIANTVRWLINIITNNISEAVPSKYVCELLNLV